VVCNEHEPRPVLVQYPRVDSGFRMFTLQKMISEVSEPRFWEAHGWSDGVVCELVETCGDVRGFVKDSFVVRTVEAAASGKK